MCVLLRVQHYIAERSLSFPFKNAIEDDACGVTQEGTFGDLLIMFCALALMAGEAREGGEGRSWSVVV